MLSPFQPSLKSAFIPAPLLSTVLCNFNSISVCYPDLPCFRFLFFSILKQNWPKSFKYTAKEWRRREQQFHTISSFVKSSYPLSPPFFQPVTLLLISGRKTEVQRGVFHLPPRPHCRSRYTHLPADLPGII